MSTRKNATAITAAKVENAITTETSGTSGTTNATSGGCGGGVDKNEMGTNASTVAKTTTITTSENINNTSESTGGGSTNKEATTNKQDTKQQQQQRITRNSPLLLISPTTAAGGIKKEAADSEPTNSESEDGGSKKSAPIRSRKSIKEAKEATKQDETSNTEKDTKEKDIKEKDCSKEKDSGKEDNKEQHKDTKDSKEKDKDKEKEAKETKDHKEKDTKESRLTRKSFAKELVSNTRTTRNRQTSTSRPETPPHHTGRGGARGRGGAAGNARKMPVPESTASKRKRSIDDVSASGSSLATDQPGAKYIKIDIKRDHDATTDDEQQVATPAAPTSIAGAPDLDGVKIKQELMESDESATEASTSVASSSTTAAASRGRGGQRWNARKPHQQQISPSTRATRQNKLASPSPSTATGIEPKRRRTTGGNAVTRSSSMSLLKSTVTNAHAPDEDSKDSMASSMDDLLLSDIKLEKMTPELDETTDCEMDDKSSTTTVNTSTIIATTTLPDEISKVPSIANDITEPLVNTSTTIATTTLPDEISKLPSIANDITEPLTTNSNAGDSEKAASLSPEMVSEGVSEISVKQFYKKPKFLENNLGIEEDPKLGEIVQKVSTAKDDAAAAPNATKESEPKSTKVEQVKVEDKLLEDSLSSTSLKEGELRLEESGDEKKCLSNDDAASLSTGNLSPLVVQDDDDDDDDMTNAVETDDTEKLVIEEDEMEDDDVTVEESETISMDNNASLHDDAAEERTEMMTMVIDEDTEMQQSNDGRLEEDAETKSNLKTNNINNNKNECDNEKAKLKQETKENINLNEKKVAEEDEEEESKKEEEEAKEVSIKDKEIIKNTKTNGGDGPGNENVENCKAIGTAIAAETKTLTITTNDYKKDKFEKLEFDIKNKIKEEQKLKKAEEEENNVDAVKKDKVCEKVSATEKINQIIVLEDIKNDVVVARIDAELKKIDEKLLKEKVTTPLPLAVEETTEIAEITAEPKNASETAAASSGEDEKTSIIEQMEVDKDENVVCSSATTTVNDVKESDIKEKSSDDEATTMKIDENHEDVANFNSHIALLAAMASGSTNSTKVNNKDEDEALSLKSGQSSDTNSWLPLETECDEDSLRQKEQHLQNLGLLTHKAAEQRRQEYIQISAAAHEQTSNQQQQQNHQQSHKRNGKSSTVSAAVSATAGHEYTGTLKTVIKLNRNANGGTSAAAGTSSNGRKAGQHAKDAAGGGGGVRRQSLKMTFQKGRGRGQGSAADRNGSADQQTHGEDAYYTIQNENEGAPKSANTGLEQTNIVHTHGRKSYNRSNNTSHPNMSTTSNSNNATIDSSHSEGHDMMAHTSAGLSKKDEKEEILIPEKASSFKFHPGRLCEDQCFYCSGKFGLYDTPCHVGQIKSQERQQKILANEEKLTVDNCLCDACFRHVDRRANVPSYKKRLSAPGHLGHGLLAAAAGTSNAGAAALDGTMDDGMQEDGAQKRKCLVTDCANPAAHSLRRKCIRKSVKKFLLNFDMPNGSPCVWLCQSHYDTVIQCSGCVLCKRRLGKNHMYHITSDTDRLEKALSEMGIPVQLGIGTAVCKLCRYFANLLMKPPDSTKSQKAEFVKNYRKRLLQFHNIHDGSNDASETDENDSNNGGATSSSTAQQLQQKPLGRTPQKKDKQMKDSGGGGGSLNIGIGHGGTPSKGLPSPAGSSGSSVECLEGMLATTEAEIAEAMLSNQKKKTQLQKPDNEMMVDYDMPMLSTDSNSSGSHTPPDGSSDKQQMSKLKAILQNSNTLKSSSTTTTSSSSSSADISNVLRQNPNISMRELFPGEEDLGLNFKAPFGSNSSQRTPEGWTRVQTFLQYDEPTRRLWEELQKPYGNQSSFLRHLILLEKYYRNGDLVLSPHASSNANVYTQTVRQRLTSYDQGHCGGLQSAKPVAVVTAAASAPTATSKDKSSTEIPTVEINEDDDDDVQEPEPEQNNSMRRSAAETAATLSKHLRSRSLSVDKLTKQLSTNAVTIIACPKDSSKQTTDPSPQKSLLKEKEAANVSGGAGGAAVAAASANITSNSRSILKSNLLGINKSVEILPISQSSSSSSTSSGSSASNGVSVSSVLPPTESTKQQKILDVANKLLGNQMEAAAAAASAAAIAANNQPKITPASLLTSPPELVSLHRRSSGGAGPSATTASLINNKRPQLLSAAAKTSASRSIPPPNVVILPDTLTSQERQQSKSWRPTLMPFEENQHMLNKNGPLYQTADGRRLQALVQVQSGGKPFLISIFDYNRMCILRREKLMRDQMLKASKSRRDEKSQQQQQQQQAHQNVAANLQNFHKSNSSKHQQPQQQPPPQVPIALIQQDPGALARARAAMQLQHLPANVELQMQLMQLQKQQQAAMKAARYQTIAPKPSSATALAASSIANSIPAPTTNVTVTSAANNFPSPMLPMLANAISNATSANVNPTAALSNAPWLWNHFPDASQLLMNGGGGGGNQGPKLPQLLPKATNAAPATITSAGLNSKQLLFDNALMSKIPKSLTVIPQHKLMGTGGGSSSGSGGHKE